jgi:serine protease AprX
VYISQQIMNSEHLFHEHQPNRFAVIPTPEKLSVDDRFTGRGVTMAFLDSGFYAHPDLMEGENRILAFHDVSGEENDLSEVVKPQSWHWHGTQTSVVAAGSGALSNGTYRGIASEARLVLVKVGERGGRIAEKNIERGLEWILAHREQHNIRILNISLGGDTDAAGRESRINQLAEECVRQGILVVAAAGNSAFSEKPHSIPPANSPAVLTVGGYSDENQPNQHFYRLYHSNFGATADGTVKPEVIAPAMFVAAPLLPATEEYNAAEMLSWIAHAPNYKLGMLLFEHWHQAGLPERIVYQDDKNVVRTIIETEIKRRKIVAAHYQHVDGTSFAAPIAASVAAQMLEANPNLTPAAVKNILISTAERLTRFPAVRQGYGRINARRAVSAALTEKHVFTEANFSPPRIENDKILFFHHDDNAEFVCLAGDFNRWQPAKSRFVKQDNGFWRAEIKLLPPGKYRYKFVVDKKRWTEDTSNSLKEADGFGGFNSILHLQ